METFTGEPSVDLDDTWSNRYHSLRLNAMCAPTDSVSKSHNPAVTYNTPHKHPVY